VSQKWTTNGAISACAGSECCTAGSAPGDIRGLSESVLPYLSSAWAVVSALTLTRFQTQKKAAAHARLVVANIKLPNIISPSDTAQFVRF